MILTEEQRAAIKLAMKYIARWPFAYKELHARGVLQAMIDSSEHFTDATKMIGFDLERARGLRDFLQDDCAEVGDVWAEMIAEIERLREALDESERVVAHKTKSAAHWYDEHLQVRADRVQTRRVVEQQAARIKELGADLEQSEICIRARLDVIDQQAAKIRELEDVHKRSGKKYAKIINELRSSVYANIPGLKKQWDEILNAPANGKIGPDVNEKQSDELVAAYREMRDLARCAPGSAMHRKAIERYDALRAEGKIGPDAKPREGLYGKYRISKADGSPVDPNADYFVLRLDTDPVARRAALEYSYMTPDRNLAIGLQERIAKHNPKMTDCINLQFFGLEHPRVWQITEERKAAIMETIDLLNGDLFRSPYSDVLAVLRGMLEEVA